MSINKQKIIKHLCYNELVYGRINKKMKTNYTNLEIEEFVINIVKNTPERYFSKIGKNYYITNTEKGIRITINSNNYRIITLDVLKSK